MSSRQRPGTRVNNRLEGTPGNGLQAVLQLRDFRWLWLGQIFSQLADKFYIVLMVFLIAQVWVSGTTDVDPVLALVF